MSDYDEQVWRSLEDEEYRREYAADVGTGLAFQIKLLREKNGWTQGQLAERIGNRQPTISQWENPNYGDYSLNSLKGLAAAFDLALMVKFVSFGELVEWSANLTPDLLAPPSFQEEDLLRRTSGRVVTYTAGTDTHEISATMASSPDLASALVLEGTLDENMTVQLTSGLQAPAGQTARPASAAGEERTGALAA